VETIDGKEIKKIQVRDLVVAHVDASPDTAILLLVEDNT
jgi:hypothetical protein